MKTNLLILLVAGFGCASYDSGHADTVVFASKLGGLSDIVEVDTDTGIRTKITDTPAVEEWSPVWADQTERLAWFEARDDELSIAIREVGNGRIYRLEGIPQPRRPGQGPQGESRLSWAPDGLRLAYTTVDHTFAVVEVQNGRAETLNLDDPFAQGVTWQDPKVLLGTNVGEFVWFGLDGTVTDRVFPSLSDGPGISFDMAVSPTGSTIAFISFPPGLACVDSPCHVPSEIFSPQVFVYDKSEETVTRLTGDTPFKSAPAWSPDGRHIAYTQEDGWDIVAVSVSDQTIRHLTQGDAIDYHPTWISQSKSTSIPSASWGALKSQSK